jgi:WD40 repeat protein
MEAVMRTLSGHTKDVRAVAFTPDGRLISGGSDRSVRIWNPITGECIATVKAKGPVYSISVSADGNQFAYGGRAASGAESNFVYCCNSAGKLIGSHELRTQEEGFEFVPGTMTYLRATRCVPRSIWSLDFSADGRLIAAVCRRPGGGNIPNGGGGRVWKLDGGGVIELPNDAYALAFARTGGRLAITRLRAAAFFEEPTQQPSIEYRLTADWSAAVAFVPGKDLAVVGTNSFLDFMNTSRKEKPTRLKTSLRSVLSIAVSPDGNTILVAGKPGGIEMYDTATRSKLSTFDFGMGGVHAIAYAPDGMTFAAGGDKGLAVYDAPR